MSARPDHAQDCPGCDSGWTVGDLLCPLCAAAVNTSNPELYPTWLAARSALWGDVEKMPPSGPHGWVAIEAYRRGFIVGMARMLSTARAQQHEAWQAAKTRAKERRTWRKKP